MATRLYLYWTFGTNVYPAGSKMPAGPQSTLQLGSHASALPDGSYFDMALQNMVIPASNQVTDTDPHTPGTRTYYISRFTSPILNQKTIQAGQWTYAFGTTENGVLEDGVTPFVGFFPVSGHAKSVYVNVYVWRPSTGTKYGTIYEGQTNATINNDYPHAFLDFYFHVTTFSGKKITGLIPGDAVIVKEVWFTITTDRPLSLMTSYFLLGGTTVYANDQLCPSPASYLESAQDLSFITGSLVARAPASAESVSVSDVAARLVKRNSGKPLTETVSITDSVDWRRPSHPYNKVIAMSQETVTIDDSANRTITRAVPLNKTARLQDEDLHISEDVSCQATTGAPVHTGDPGYFVT
jgi:hypothetical protein